MITCERYHDFCAGHRVYGHENKCAHLHGHNYRVHFTVAAAGLDYIGRVLDFSVVKATLCQWLEDNWDHKTLIWKNDPFLEPLRRLDPAGVLSVPFNPTAENMAAYLVNVVGPSLLDRHGVELVKCTVEETRKCSATYQKGPKHEQ